ncbi:MAG: acyltransferase family protein [Synechococcales bacterium]|nr:acyltransferase family protein [Synechococcales bacterium]
MTEDHADQFQPHESDDSILSKTTLTEIDRPQPDRPQPDHPQPEQSRLDHKLPHLIYGDSLRVVAIILVIVSHVGALVVYRQPLRPENSASWGLATFLMSIGRPCVPLFLMLSGCLLLNPQKADEPIATFFRKRLSKVAIPGLFWAFIFLAWRRWGLKEPISLVQGLQAIVSGTVFAHLWFIYLILGLYVMVPVLRVYIRGASLKNQGYFLMVWFLLTALFPLLKRFFGFDFHGFVYIPLQGYIGVFVGGYFLQQVTIAPWLRRLLPTTIVAFTAILSIASYAVAARANSTWDDYYYSYLNFFAVIMSACLFLVLRDFSYSRLFAKFPSLKAQIQWISALSFGVYLFHPIVLDILSWIVPPLTQSSVIANGGLMLSLILGTIVFSLAGVALLRKIPFMRYLLP